MPGSEPGSYLGMGNAQFILEAVQQLRSDFMSELSSIKDQQREIRDRVDRGDRNSYSYSQTEDWVDRHSHMPGDFYPGNIHADRTPARSVPSVPDQEHAGLPARQTQSMHNQEHVPPSARQPPALVDHIPTNRAQYMNNASGGTMVNQMPANQIPPHMSASARGNPQIRTDQYASPMHNQSYQGQMGFQMPPIHLPPPTWGEPGPQYTLGSGDALRMTAPQAYPNNATNNGGIFINQNMRENANPPQYPVNPGTNTNHNAQMLTSNAVPTTTVASTSNTRVAESHNTRVQYPTTTSSTQTLGMQNLGCPPTNTNYPNQSGSSGLVNAYSNPSVGAEYPNTTSASADAINSTSHSDQSAAPWQTQTQSNTITAVTNDDRDNSKKHNNAEDTHVRVKNFIAKEMDWLDYRDYFSGVAEKANWSDNLKCAKLLGALDNSLLGITADLAPNYTFQHLLAKLDHIQGAEYASRDARNQLNAIRRRDDESIPIFAERCRRLTSRAYPDYHVEAKNEQALNALIKGLPKEFRFRLKMQSFAKLYDAVSFASNLDHVMKEERMYDKHISRSVEVENQHEYVADSDFDSEFEIIRKTQDRLNKQFSKFEKRYGKSDQRNNNKSEPATKTEQKTCLTCGCEQKPVRNMQNSPCFKCGQYFHWAMECPLNEAEQPKPEPDKQHLN